MKKIKIWITGASGFLGSTICQTANTSYEITGFYYRNKPKLNVELNQLDLCNTEQLKNSFDTNLPNYVVHCAAMSNTTHCKMQPKKSELINVNATQHLAQLCSINNIKLIFISTDLVFDGEQAPYKELDHPNPLLIYSKHKRDAEIEVLTASSKHLIIRLPLLIGKSPITNRGYLNSAINSMQSGKDVYLFEDEYRTPLGVHQAAKGILQFKEEEGIFHLSGTERVSRMELGFLIKEHLLLSNAKLVSTKQKEHSLSEPRPRDVSLDCTKALQLGFKPGSLIDAIRNDQ